MINEISDSSDRSVTVPKALRSLPKSASELRFSLNSDRSDRKSRVPTTRACAYAHMSVQPGNALDRSLLSLRALPHGGA